MVDKPKGPTLEDEIEQMRIELRVMGFGIVKYIALAKKMESGTMKCPLCQKKVTFSIASSNKHMRAKCQTEDCIHMME